jgi:predicted nucleic acid-binding protein
VIVIDASAILEVLLRTTDARAALEWMQAPRQTLHAPHLIDIEVAQVLRRYATAGGVDAEGYRRALLHFGDLPVIRYPHTQLLARIWELRSQVSARDAAYIALAEMIDAPLITHDRKLARASGHSARIELV